MELSKVNWRSIMRHNFTSWEKLAHFLELNLDETVLKQPKFSLNLPLRLASKIEKGNPSDPILKQFLPTLEETLEQPTFSIDPVGDLRSAKSAKILHKYQSRALILSTSACAMHCRYCFRQNFPYETVRKDFEDELEALRNNPSINELILSGGDPLSLGNEVLEKLFYDVSKISHIKKIRFHTRFPIGIPERIDEGFFKIISGANSQIYFVVHCNHPKELDEEIVRRLKMVQKAGAVLLCQSVLLKGVNDEIETLVTLCESLIDIGVLPYYLHQLDKVRGSQHFEVSEEQGKALVAELCKRLPGYAVPRYVKEIAGEAHKTLIN